MEGAHIASVQRATLVSKCIYLQLSSDYLKRKAEGTERIVFGLDLPHLYLGLESLAIFIPILQNQKDLGLGFLNSFRHIFLCFTKHQISLISV